MTQTKVPGVLVSQVAHQYNVNANQVFIWLRDPHFRPPKTSAEMVTFLPVKVIAEDRPVRHERHGDCGSIEIGLTSRHRLRLIGAFDPEVVALLAQRFGRNLGA